MELLIIGAVIIGAVAVWLYLNRDTTTTVASSPMAPGREVSLEVHRFEKQARDAWLDIVGEGRYQDEIRKVAGPSGDRGVANPNATAIVMREPTNPADPNAVVAYLMGSDGRHTGKAGYLSRENALAYRPVFELIAPSSIIADAFLTGGWDRGGGDRGSIGVRLHLGTPGELLAELMGEPEYAPPRSGDNPWAGKTVVFTGPSGFAHRRVQLGREMQEALAVAAGCQVHPRVTKKVDLLVASSPQPSAKFVKAREYGIETIPEHVFWGRLGYQLQPLALGITGP